MLRKLGFDKGLRRLEQDVMKLLCRLCSRFLFLTPKDLGVRC